MVKDKGQKQKNRESMRTLINCAHFRCKTVDADLTRHNLSRPQTLPQTHMHISTQEHIHTCKHMNTNAHVYAHTHGQYTNKHVRTQHHQGYLAFLRMASRACVLLVSAVSGEAHSSFITRSRLVRKPKLTYNIQLHVIL